MKQTNPVSVSPWSPSTKNPSEANPMTFDITSPFHVGYMVAGTRIELVDSVMLPMFGAWYRTGSFS